MVSNRSAVVLFIAVIVLSICPSPTQAEGCIDWSQYAHWSDRVQLPGCASDVAVSGEYAYAVGSGTDLQVIRLNGPAGPTVVASLSQPVFGIARGIVLQNQRAYICTATFEGGATGFVWVVDITNPESPSTAGIASTSDVAFGLSVSDDILCVAVYSSGLEVFDLSDPDVPVTLGRIRTPGRAWGVTIVDTLAYVADSAAGLQIVNIADPQDPAIIGSCDTPGQAYEITVCQSLAYVTDDYGGVAIIDASTPSAPAPVATLTEYGRVLNVLPFGDDIIVLGDGGSAIAILDCSDPIHPTPVLELATNSIANIAVSGTTVYALAECTSFDVLRLAQYQTIASIAEADSIGTMRTIEVLEDHAYLGGWDNDLLVLDVHDPKSPTVVASLPLADDILDLEIKDRLLYVATDRLEGLYVVDISDPNFPQTRSFLEIQYGLSSLAIADNFIYATGKNRHFHIIDISDPDQPVIKSTLSLTWWAHTAAVSGTYAYIANGYSGLAVIDVSDPLSPYIASFYDTEDAANHLVLVDSVVYMLESGKGLHIIDVSTPTAPTALGQWPDRDLNGHDLRHGFLYMASSDGIYLVDVSMPSVPRVTGYANTSSPAIGLAVAGDYLYSVHHQGGLKVFPAHCDDLTPITVTSIDAAAIDGGVRITWQVQEGQFQGFHILRALRPDAPDDEYENLNPHDPIRGSGPWEFLDRDVCPGQSYTYRIAALVPGGGTQLFGRACAIAPAMEILALMSPSPNPIVEETTLRFQIPRAGSPLLGIYDLGGRCLRQLLAGHLDAGLHTVVWDGRNDSGARVANGMYLIRLSFDGQSSSRRLIVVQ